MEKFIGVNFMERAIGVIDSGVGGLTVVQELMRQLPKERFIYLGDTLRCPYGPRPAEEVRKFTFEMVDFLLEKDIKMIVIACNTATAFALKELQEELNIPVVGVIKPGARAAIKATKNRNVAIIGTEGTIGSDAYPQALHKINSNLIVTSLACPQFVPMVEQGIVEGEEVLEVVEKTLAPLQVNQKIDTLILGCTHYPLLESTIQTVMGPNVALISSSEETAREASTILEVHNLLNTKNRQQKHQFYSTGDLSLFKKVSQILFDQEIKNLKTVTIEQVVI